MENEDNIVSQNKNKNKCIYDSLINVSYSFITFLFLFLLQYLMYIFIISIVSVFNKIKKIIRE